MEIYEVAGRASVICLNEKGEVGDRVREAQAAGEHEASFGEGINRIKNAAYA